MKFLFLSKKNSAVQQELDDHFSELTSLIFTSFSAQDYNGKTEKPYNSDEVSKKWSQYHGLVNKIRSSIKEIK